MRPSRRVIFAWGGLQLVAFLYLAIASDRNSPVHGATIIVTNTNDSGPGSLRQALADVSNGGMIQFDPGLNGQTILLTTAGLAIDKNITIDGPGANQLAVTKSAGAPDFQAVPHKL